MLKAKKFLLNKKYKKGRYKLLTSQNYRDTLGNKLKEIFISNGRINKETKISYGLIAGKIYKQEEIEFEKYFDKKNWFFWGPKTIKEKLLELARKGYEDNSITMTVKLLVAQNIINSRE